MRNFYFSCLLLVIDGRCIYSKVFEFVYWVLGFEFMCTRVCSKVQVSVHRHTEWLCLDEEGKHDKVEMFLQDLNLVLADIFASVKM